MNPSEQKIAAFESRVRQLILRFQELKKENSALSAQIEASEKQIADLQARLGQAGRDYDSLKMAKMMEITNGDLESAKVRLSKLIRDVNKCITVLSDEQ
jgi:predicted RNase H-like nuclease (RuvC/YqgF family)